MSTSSATLFGTLGQALSFSGRALVALKTAWERRRIVSQLAALDDHMLRDIGITRHDILSVLAEPLYRDPSECLAVRAAATRRARRATAAYELEARAAEDHWSVLPTGSRHAA